MNVAFFLSPKSEVVYLYRDMPLSQAMEIMEEHRYQALPVLNTDGTCFGVIAEGDILWALYGKEKTGITMDTLLEEIPRYREYQTVKISEDMDSLLEAACRQSFVPVTDDSGIFIGIIRRRDIIEYYSHVRTPARSCAPAVRTGVLHGCVI